MKVALKTTDDIESAAKYFTSLMQQACWANTLSINGNKVVNYPLLIKMAILEKRRLRGVWHQIIHKDDKTKFNKACNDLRNTL